jgi:aspartate/methionine/tyrosine aminotransferase
MRFPLADWIDAHAGCRHDLGTSGMRGSIPPPPWPRRRPGQGAEDELRDELAEHVGVAPERVFLSHGASEANAWVLGYLAARPGRSTRRPIARVRPPEYPPLFEAARAVGFRVATAAGAADVAIVSRPRNPEGDAWPEEDLERFAAGTRQLLIDETFREFGDLGSMARAGFRGRWTTGSLTKFYGADEVRLGWAVSPPEATAAFGRYVGLVSDEVAPASAAAATELLRRFASVRSSVRRVVDRNVRAFRAAYPGAAPPVAPLYFDRPASGGGRPLAKRCLDASVLVCPGEFFGDRRGVRVCLTRRDFPESLRAYLRVRGPTDGSSAGRTPV